MAIRGFQNHVNSEFTLGRVTTFVGSCTLQVVSPLVNYKCMKEVWKDVVGYEGLYQVSNLGGLRSCPKLARGRNGGSRRLPGRSRSINPHPSGRIIVTLYKNNVGKGHYLHRLVLEAFVGPCPVGMECRHFPDRDQSNCRLDNLQWGTSKENKADMVFHGTRPSGSRSGMAKLDESKVESIIEGLKRGESNTRLARIHNVSQSVISDIRRGKSWNFGSLKRRDLGEGARGIRGTGNHNAKLNPKIVRRIRKEYEKRKRLAPLSEKFGVSVNTILNVVTRKTWGHVD